MYYLGNNVSLKVDVQFPTQKELQDKLNKYNLSSDLKVKLSAESIRDLKKQIGGIQGIKANVTLDTTSAKSKLNTVIKQLSDVDKLVNKSRTLNIKVDVKDIDKKLSSLVSKMESATSQPIKATTDKVMANVTKEMDKIQRQAQKISQQVGYNASGEMNKHKVVTTNKDNNGKTTTQTVDKMTGQIDTKVVKDREKALQNYANQLKNVHKLELELSRAKSQETKDRLRQDIKGEKELANEIKTRIKAEYGRSAINSDGNISMIESEHKKNKANQVAKRKELEDTKKLHNEFKNMVKLQRELSSLQKKSHGLTGEEQKKSDKQIKNLTSELQAIKEKNNGFKEISKIDRDNLANSEKQLRRSEEIAKAKHNDKENAKEQKFTQDKLNNAYKDYADKMAKVDKISKNLLTAKGEEKRLLQEQAIGLNQEIKGLKEKYNHFRQVSSELKEQTTNAQKERKQAYEVEKAKVKEREKERQHLDERKQKEKHLNSEYGKYIQMSKQHGALTNKTLNMSGEELKATERQVRAIESEMRLLEEKNNKFRDLNDIQKEGIRNLETQKARNEEIALARSVDKDNEKAKVDNQKKLNNAFNDYVGKQKALTDIKSKLITADGEERKQLQAREGALQRELGQISEKHNGFRQISEEQRKQLDNVKAEREQRLALRQAQNEDKTNNTVETEKQNARKRDIQSYIENLKKVVELERKIATMSEGAERQRMRESLNLHQRRVDGANNRLGGFSNAEQSRVDSVMATHNLRQAELSARHTDGIVKREEELAIARATKSLEEMFKIKKRIIELESKTKFGTGEEQELSHLRTNLQARENIYNMMERESLSASNRSQADHIRDNHNASAEQYRNEVAKNRELEKATGLLNEHARLNGELVQMQRSLMFTGQREGRIVAEQIQQQEQRLRIVREQINANEHISQSQREQLDNEQRLQREATRTARARQKAKDRDRANNDTHGAIDFHSTAMDFRQGFTTVLDSMATLDEAYMRVAKVADATDEKMAQFKANSFDTASQLGVTADQYMNAVEVWVTAGKTLEEAKTLSEISLKGSFVGNIEPDKMVKYMSVPLQAFSKEGLEANDIINTMNEVSNENAIEMDELGKAYMRSATSVGAYGVSFEELTGMITGAQEETRMGGERIGTAMKTMSINYGLLQSQQTDAQKKKYDFFKGLGIDLKEKSFFEVIGSLKSMWGELDKGQRSTVAFNLAGKEHTNVLNAIISQWDTVNKAKNEASGELGEGENGSAYIEFNKQRESFRFKIAELTNAWNEFLNKVGSSDGIVAKVLKTLTDGLQLATEYLSNPVVSKLLFGTLGMVAISGLANGFRRMFDIITGGARRSTKDMMTLYTAMRGFTDLDGNPRGDGRRSVNGDRRNNNGGHGGGDDSIILSRSERRRREREERRERQRREREERQNGGNGGNGNNGNNGGNGDSDRVRSSTMMSMRGLKSISGKLLGMIPVLGQGLFIAELLGIDVIGSVVDLFKNTKDNAEKMTANIEKDVIALQKTGVYDNTISKNENGYQKINKATKQTYKGKDGKEYYTDKQFRNIQKETKLLAEKLGIDVELKINDKKEVDRVRKVLEREKKRINSESMVDTSKVVTKSIDDRYNLQQEKSKGQDRKKEIKKELGVIEPRLKEMKKKPVQSFEDIKMRDMDENRIKKLKEELEGIDKAGAKADKSISKIDSSLKKIGKEMLSFDKDTLKLGFENMNVEQTRNSMSLMADELGKIKNGSKLASESLKLIKSPKIDQSGFKDLMSNVNELGESLGGDFKKKAKALETINFDQFKNNTNGAKDKILELVNSMETFTSTSAKQGDVAMQTAVAHMKALGMTEHEIKIAIGVINGYTGALIKIPKDIVTQVKAQVIGKAELDGMMGVMRGIQTMPEIRKTITMTTKRREITEKVIQGKSVVEAMGETRNNSAKSNKYGFYMPNLMKSVSSNEGIGASISSDVADISTSNSISSTSNSIASTSNAKSSNKKSSSKKTSKKDDKKKKEKPNNSKIDQDVWRYWKTELGLDKLGSAFDDLERNITLANGSIKKITSAYRSQLRNINATLSKNTVYKSQKESEINSVLRQLRKYGFKTNTRTNTISNLGHAKNIKGKNAEKSEELLNKYKGLMTDLKDITANIKNAKVDKQQVIEADRTARVDNEAKRNEKELKKTDRVTKAVENKNAYNSEYLDRLSTGDYEQRLKVTESSMNGSKKNISSLVAEFNRLAKLQHEYPENAEEIKGALDTIGESIKSESQSVLEYEQQLKAIRLERLVADFEKFSQAIEKADSKMSALRDNVQGGLISGTDLKDYEMANTGSLSFGRKNKVEKTESEYLSLIKNVDKQLDDFEKKSILKYKSYANKKIQITKSMYDELIKQSHKYNSYTTTSKKPTLKKGSTKKVAQYKSVKKYKGVNTKDKRYKNAKTRGTNILNDFLKKNKISYSKTNKRKLAKQYGIKDYKGTQKQQEALYRKMNAKTKKVAKTTTGYKYKSNRSSKTLNSFLKSNKVSYSKANKKKLAKSYGIKNYKGTKKQDNLLMKKMKAKKVTSRVYGNEASYYNAKNKKTVKTYAKGSTAKSLNSFLKANKMSVSLKNKKALAKKHGVKNYKGTKAQDNALLKKMKSAKRTTYGKAVKKTTTTNKKAYVYKNNRNTKSLSSFLKSNGMESSMKKQTELARKYHIKNYTGTQKQQAQLLALMKKATTTVTSTATKYYDKKGKQISKSAYEKLYGGKTTVNKPTEKNDVFTTLDTNFETKGAKAIAQVVGAYGMPKYLASLYSSYKTAQDKLLAKYSTDDLNSNKQINTKFLMEQTALQEKLQKDKVTATQNAIKELEKMKSAVGMSTDDIAEIEDQIASMQDEVIESQSAIKELIAQRFEYEFAFIDEALERYTDYQDDLTYSYSVLEALTGKNHERKMKLLKEESKNQSDYVKDLQNLIKVESAKRDSYKTGSYEWNIINDKVKEYKETLEDANLELLDMNKNLMSMSLDNLLEGFQKATLGQTLGDYSDFTDRWVTGLEKSLSLEQIHLQAKESEVTAFNDRLQELSQQDKVSRNELALIQKQIELEELRNKLAEMSNERDVQVLKQKEDGTWDWAYESSTGDEIKQQLVDKELEIEQIKQQYLKSYMSELEGVLEKAKNGEFENADDFKKALLDVNGSYEKVVATDKLLDTATMDKLLSEFGLYNKLNNDIANGVVSSVDKHTSKGGNAVDENYLKNYLDGKVQVDTLLKGTGNPLITDRYTSSVSNSVTSTGDKGQTFMIEKLEFPNVNSSEDIKQALMDLPRYAKEQAQAR